MVKSDNNNSNSIMPRNFKDAVQNRRVLSVINQNLLQDKQYPHVIQKRVLSEKPEIREKKQADPSHRPITRRFAAQVISKQQSCTQEPKKSSSPVSNSNGSENTVITEDELKSLAAQPAPMSLEQSGPIYSDPYQMEEVEMEDISEVPILDIDSCDVNNPLAAVEYIKDLHSYYRRVESISRVSPDYMAQQFDINEKMRAILIEWLIEVHDKFDLVQETLFLTINLIDRFLAKQTVVRKKLQLVGMVALLLACKYEEVSVPVVGDFILLSDNAYSRKEVLEMERLMLNTLQFNMSVPTAYVFIRRFLKAAEADKKLELLAFFLIELSLMEYEMLKFPPSMQAAAAVYTAQCTVNGFKQWNRKCEWHSTYSEDQLLECSSMMVRLHQKTATTKLKGVHRKYCSSKYAYTAQCEPAHFLLEDHA
ncbi:PREDICTED: G2/mitotic-specific cyclin-2-like isoform X2 [Lupinus angustifolius]|uniref:G2/mitotic-specific cyclin-2-like isoform X2 n=1 Tax=Lupinus angustifolius TaxID=3871 RepID=UPI00092FAE67|nr:PREDICTED: G2/mitotic-specific cyclin-2-like isoform X2 [Lupinus angustifolius]